MNLSNRSKVFPLQQSIDCFLKEADRFIDLSCFQGVGTELAKDVNFFVVNIYQPFPHLNLLLLLICCLIALGKEPESMSVLAFSKNLLSKELNVRPALMFAEEFNQVKEGKKVLRTLPLDRQCPINIMGNNGVFLPFTNMVFTYFAGFDLLLIIQML